MRLVILFMLALTPLPFGSASPIWQQLYVVIIGVATLIKTINLMSSKSSRHKFTLDAAILFFPIAAFSCVILFGYIQALGLFLPWADVINGIIKSGVNPPMMSTDPYQSISVTTYFLAHMLFFLLVFSTIKSKSDIRRLFAAIVVFGFFYALYSFASHESDNRFIFWYEKSTRLNSLSGTFVNRNNYTAYIGIIIIVSCACLFDIFTKKSTTKRFRGDLHILTSENNFHRGLFHTLFIFLAATTVAISGSRGGLATILAGLLANIFLFNRLHIRIGAAPLKRTIVILILVILVVFFISGSHILERMQFELFEDARASIYPIVIDAILNEPLTGYGAGTFKGVFSVTRVGLGYYSYQRAHSDLLELALSIGLPATLAFVLAFFSLAVSLVRSFKTAPGASFSSIVGLAVMVQIAAHSVVDFPLQIPAISLLVATILAAAMKGVVLSSPAQIESPTS